MALCWEVFFKGMCWVVPPPRMPVANEGLLGSPTKNIIILVVTVTGQGDNPMYVLYSLGTVD